MKARRITTVLVAGGLLAAGIALAGASPASAASFTFDGCDQSNYILPEGDTLVLTYADCDYDGFSVYDGATSSVDATDPAAVSVLVAAGPGFIGLNNTGPGGNALVGACDAETAYWNVAWTLVDLCAGPGSAPGAIPEWVQAYGRTSADATCADGWNASWQEWAQQVTGGWVCTRSIPSLG